MHVVIFIFLSKDNKRKNYKNISIPSHSLELSMLAQAKSLGKFLEFHQQISCVVICLICSGENLFLRTKPGK
jgi:hypothetical protein